MTRDWDAATYARVSSPQLKWGLEVLERVPLRGDETVLDAGCGTGRVTAVLAERLPSGRVIGVDASPSMVEKARVAVDGDFIVADLQELVLDEPVDAVISTATFHWIPDHDRLFRRLFAALKPGGLLEAQCGGAGNLERAHEHLHRVAAEARFAPHFEGWQGPWNYCGAEETEAALIAAGFDEVRCWLEPREVHPPEPREFLRTVCLGAHIERLPEDLRAPYVDAVLERAGDPLVLDYVRLNIHARRS